MIGAGRWRRMSRKYDVQQNEEDFPYQNQEGSFSVLRADEVVNEARRIRTHFKRLLSLLLDGGEGVVRKEVEIVRLHSSSLAVYPT